MLVLSALCGIAFGYAAQRGSLCVISGIDALLEGRSPRVFLSFLRCSVWVILATLPLAWAIPGDQLDWLASPTLVTVGAGLLFGMGAAINGGCSFGTLIRLGGGDASFVATLAGLGFGFLLHQQAPQLDLAPVQLGRSPLETPGVAGVLVLVVTGAFCIRELVLYRARQRSGTTWPPEHAALMMGLAGGLLYALHGSWAYTLAIERALSTMSAGGIPDLTLLVIFVACIFGAALGARKIQQFRFQLNIRDLPKHLLGGIVMGVAAALIPGGNDVLVLHALPALSPHAPLAYSALVVGAAGALLLSKFFARIVTAREGS